MSGRPRDGLLWVDVSTHDFVRRLRGLFLTVTVLPTPSLMGREDEGRLILSALTISAGIGFVPFLYRQRFYRSFAYWHAHSDADEIATRLAARAEVQP
jgi:hypothetical protein